MTRQLSIYVKNLSEYIGISRGETLGEIGRRLAGRLGFEPVCALVNNKNEDLWFELYHPKQVEFQPLTTASATRVYTRSLCMLLYRAVTRCYPGARLRIEHTISGGYYCRLDGAGTVDESTAETLTAEMRSLVARDLPFEPHECLTADAIEIFRAQGLDDKVELLETTRELYTRYYSLDGICDSYYGALVQSTRWLSVFALRPYHEGLLLLGFDRNDPSQVSHEVKQEKMFKAFVDYLRFNNIVGVRNVGELNRMVEHGMASQLISLAEALHEKIIAGISDDIARRYRDGGARVVLVAGPSSSGKTTTTKRLAIQLMTNLLKPQIISLDNYFIDRENTPRDEDGDYDYESLYALDLKKFNDDLNAIIAGEEVELPTYNFELGRRQYKGDTVHLDEGSVLLIEGIHGLNPELTSAIAENMKYRVYVSALTTLSIDDHNWIPTSDNRLLRRIIRDARYRGTSPEESIRRWPSVRRGEEKWIFPFQENADATFNSSLLFELGVMKEYAEALLKTVPNDVPEYAEAYRLRKFLSYFAAIGDASIPPTSLLREFLGGSSFKY